MDSTGLFYKQDFVLDFACTLELEENIHAVIRWLLRTFTEEKRYVRAEDYFCTYRIFAIACNAGTILICLVPASLLCAASTRKRS